MDKRQRNQFEILYLNYYDEFHEQGQEAVEKLAKSNYNKVLEEAIRQRLVCHGIITIIIL